MNSPILNKLAKKKSGWWPQALVDEDTKKIKRNACMVTNGKDAILVEVTKEDLDNRGLDEALEKKALAMILKLEERDSEIMHREVIIFSAIAMACVNQAQFFVPLVRQEAKMKMNQFKGDTLRFVETIQKEAVGIHGDQMAILLDSLEDATHRTFQKFGDALIYGKMPEFIQMIENFQAKPPDADKNEIKTEPLKKQPKPKPKEKKPGLKVIK